MIIFEQGQLLQAIYFNDDSVLEVGREHAGMPTVTEIMVVMENGQMAGVPWFLVTLSDGSQTKWNAAHVDGVKLRGTIDGE